MRAPGPARDLWGVEAGRRQHRSPKEVAIHFRNSRLAVIILALLAGIVIVDLIWLPFSSIDPNKVLWLATMAASPLVVLWAALGGIRYQLRKTPFRFRDRSREIAARLQTAVAAWTVTAALSIALLLFSYLASATDRPLMDRYLAASDAALGFDWMAYVSLLNDHPSIAAALSMAYRSLQVQLLLLPAILALTGRSSRLLEFIALYGLAGCLTCLVVIAVPAAGAFNFYHPATDILRSFGSGASTRHLEQLHALRTLQPFLIEHPEGLVTFPSFHSALAVLFAYSVRGIRYVSVPIYGLNAMLILATVPQGSHYLIDVLAGFAIAAISIKVVWWIAHAPMQIAASGEHAQSTQKEA
ncbi:phosphatase PAP2 family protein [Mesorhizobium sp. M4A.F.Ca.ET.022.05.2.1]|uniref:phosphatase PAP2 family protein n=1 Tax=Mesorhizobium sp. M4A.F.Ca.ET.022.05.2.1 TaxID=2496653 RepID=UPI000FC9C73C|nr:phosphatase PAP2 family protein [Mesorhizobium sp. M4A.F.Ca.ET.022.05.2.1]RVC81530.1 phosphatase PAP2 family protein [Mesorhizobium sp. M4A.F.Ca.ET.022.05.2.1]